MGGEICKMEGMVPCGGRRRVEPGRSVQLNQALQCPENEATKKEFGPRMRQWVEWIHANPPPGTKVMAFCWPNSSRCSGCIIFEDEAALMKYKNNEYDHLLKVMSPYIVEDKTVFDHGTVWKSSSRKEMEDGMNYLRIWSYEVKDGKEHEMEQFWTKELGKLSPHDMDWMMYSCARPAYGRWSLALSQRIGSIGDRYIWDEQASVESGPLSSIVKGPATYDDYWILAGVSYPH